MVENVYNTSVVLDVFCKNFLEIAEIGNITPVVSMLHKDIDDAYAMVVLYKADAIVKFFRIKS